MKYVAASEFFDNGNTMFKAIKTYMTIGLEVGGGSIGSCYTRPLASYAPCATNALLTRRYNITRSDSVMSATSPRFPTRAGRQGSWRGVERIRVLVIGEERERLDVRVRYGQPLYTHGFQINLARFYATSQRVAASPLYQMHSERNSTDDGQQSTNDDEEKYPQSGNIGRVLHG